MIFFYLTFYGSKRLLNIFISSVSQLTTVSLVMDKGYHPIIAIKGHSIYQFLHIPLFCFFSALLKFPLNSVEAANEAACLLVDQLEELSMVRIEQLLINSFDIHVNINPTGAKHDLYRGLSKSRRKKRIVRPE